MLVQLQLVPWNFSPPKQVEVEEPEQLMGRKSTCRQHVESLLLFCGPGDHKFSLLFAAESYSFGTPYL